MVERNKLELETVRELEEIFDQRYVLQTTCDDKQATVNKKFSNDNLRIEIMAHDFKIIKWMVTTVAAACTSSLVISIFDLILK